MSQIRSARMDDTAAIAHLMQSHIQRWQRINDQGGVEDVAYTDLSLYERWLHGGPWMSVEMAAIQLSHWLRGAGQPYVLEDAGRILAYAEAVIEQDAAPLGRCLFVSQRVVSADVEQPAAYHDALMDTLLEAAQPLGRIALSCPVHDEASGALFRRYGLSAVLRTRQYNVPAQTGQSFYKAVPHPSPNPAQIAGWGMPIGRTGGARYHWETLWPPLWDAFPQITAHKLHHLSINAAGQDAFVCLQEHYYHPRAAEVFCWTPKPLTSHLLVAIRDWAHRQGYRSLTMTMSETSARLLGGEPEALPHETDIYLREV